ncbi:tRNA pseudouridine(55) synthase [Malassezia sp. CBS 17886]|nr:tRNA pseudouridine(55) synthase [Malassezia sp. CBS 17886]
MPQAPRKASCVSHSDRPLSGLFAIAKPSGPTSMALLDELKPLLASSSLFYERDAPPPFRGPRKNARRLKPWERALVAKCGRVPPKLGQGGTLDPLAEGVLVVGVGAATKQLQHFLACTKEYRTTGLLGTATTSYDSNEPVLRHAPHSHVSAGVLKAKLPLFTGHLQQIPPVYSAIRMDGRRLFEYAREGIPLPRPIKPRAVSVKELRLVEWLSPGEHSYAPPTAEVPAPDRALFEKMRAMAAFHGVYDTVKEEASGEGGSEDGAAHVVRLIRTRQGQFSLGSAAGDARTSTGADAHIALPGNCIPWSVFERGLAELRAAKENPTQPALDTRDESGLREWERVLLSRMELA